MAEDDAARAAGGNRAGRAGGSGRQWPCGGTFPATTNGPADLAAATLMWQQHVGLGLHQGVAGQQFLPGRLGRGGPLGRRRRRQPRVHAAGHHRRRRTGRRLRRSIPRSGALGRQIECLRRLIGAGAGDEVPFIQTIFSPLAQAKNLAGQERLIVHLRQAPRACKPALEIITETTLRFIEAAKATGIAGIYYAVQLANYGLLSEAEYREFGEPYDRRILEAVERSAGSTWSTCTGRTAMFDLVAAYPGPSARTGTIASRGRRWARARRASAARCAAGWSTGRTCCAAIRSRSAGWWRDAIEQTGGQRLIVSSGCVAPVNAPFCNLRPRVARERGGGRRPGASSEPSVTVATARTVGAARRGEKFGRTRRFCRYCGFIHFVEPKVAVAALVSDGDRVLLVRRAPSRASVSGRCPRATWTRTSCPKRRWSREVAEETGVQMPRDRAARRRAAGRLAGTAGHPAALRGGRGDRRCASRRGTMSAMRRWFGPDEIPWDELAFESTAEYLRGWVGRLD